MPSTLALWGALFFGIVVGWVTYRTLRRSQTNGLSDIATVIGAVGGAAVTTLFPAQSDMFGTYSIGLAIGFFGYLLVAGFIEIRAPNSNVNNWLGPNPGAPNQPQATGGFRPPASVEKK